MTFRTGGCIPTKGFGRTTWMMRSVGEGFAIGAFFTGRGFGITAFFTGRGFGAHKAVDAPQAFRTPEAFGAPDVFGSNASRIAAAMAVEMASPRMLSMATLRWPGCRTVVHEVSTEWLHQHHLP